MTIDPSVPQEEQRTDLVSRSQPASGEQLREWLSKAKILAERIGSNEIAQEIAAVQTWIDVPVFRVAVVGASGRGKSALINRLLDVDVLPTGDVPTTASPITIVADGDEGLELEMPDGSLQRRQLDDAAWEDQVATTEAGNERQITTPIRLHLNNSWLRELSAEIVDTPGVTGFSSGRSAIARQALHTADAAILVVAAHSAFSQTERAFLEEDILGYGIGRAVVALTMLDRVPLDQRRLVVRVLEAKIKEVAPDLTILAAHPLDAETPADHALEVLRQHVEALARVSDHRAMRNHQIAVQLARCVTQLMSMAQLANDQEGAERSEQKETAQGEREALSADEIKWEQIRIELDRRRIALVAAFRSFLDDAQHELGDRLIHDLDHVSDLKQWCETELPHRLRRDLTAAVKGFEASMRKTIDRDLTWLESILQKEFVVDLERRPVPVAPAAGSDIDSPRFEVRNLHHMELLSRLGIGVMPLIGAVLRGPLGLAVSLVVSLIGHRLVEGKAQEQRERVRGEIQQCLETAFADYAKAVGKTLTRIYDDLGEQTRNHHKAWRDSRLRGLKDVGEPETKAPLASLLAKITELHSRVIAGLN